MASAIKQLLQRCLQYIKSLGKLGQLALRIAKLRLQRSKLNQNRWHKSSTWFRLASVTTLVMLVALQLTAFYQTSERWLKEELDFNELRQLLTEQANKLKQHSLFQAVTYLAKLFTAVGFITFAKQLVQPAVQIIQLGPEAYLTQVETALEQDMQTATLTDVTAELFERNAAHLAFELLQANPIINQQLLEQVRFALANLSETWPEPKVIPKVADALLRLYLKKHPMDLDASLFLQAKMQLAKLLASDMKLLAARQLQDEAFFDAFSFNATLHLEKVATELLAL